MSARMQGIILRGTMVSIVVGTLLTVINQYEHIMDSRHLNYLKAALSYVVPFGVSVFSALAIKPEPHTDEKT